MGKGEVVPVLGAAKSHFCCLFGGENLGTPVPQPAPGQLSTVCFQECVKIKRDPARNEG